MAGPRPYQELQQLKVGFAALIHVHIRRAGA